MKRPNKYRYFYKMWSNYGYGWEVECEEDTWSEAKAQIRCYRENCPNASYRLTKARELIQPVPTV